MTPREAFGGGTAVITGAGSGIGEALAHHAAACGMQVVVAEVSAERGERVAADIRNAGGTASFFEIDVRDMGAMRALADHAYRAHGDVRLLVNNAGISVMGLIWEISDADWDRSIDINYRGVVNGVRAFVPRMLASPEQTYICNVASLASFSMDRSVAPYFTTKHAVLSLSECLYIEMMDQPNPVRISATVPGFIATRIFADSALASEACEGQRDLMEAAVRGIGMSAQEAAGIILSGVAEGQFLISTHPDMTAGLASDRSEYLRTLRTPRPSDTTFLADLLPGAVPATVATGETA